MRTALVFIVFASSLAKADFPTVYHRFGNLHGVPPALLYAVALTEAAKTGEEHPWPWTANIAGTAHYYESRIDMYEALSSLVESKQFLFDVGPMQISWKWNSHLFDGDLWQATDPYANVEAGARFLSDLRDRSGSYNTAVALYHVGSLTNTERKRRAYEYCLKVQSNLPLTRGSNHE